MREYSFYDSDGTVATFLSGPIRLLYLISILCLNYRCNNSQDAPLEFFQMTNKYNIYPSSIINCSFSFQS